MTFANFCTLFLFFLVAGSLSVTGWFFITRGEEIVLEDGTKKRNGKIFKNWYFFWTKQKPCKKKIYFDENHIAVLLAEIKSYFYAEGLTHISRVGRTVMIVKPELFYDQMKLIEKNYQIRFFDKGGGQYAIYKEYPNYVYAYWVKDPLAVCATCFSSIYGSIFYWSLVALVKKPLFTWSGSPALAAIFFWIAFCFSLSVLNTALAKKFN